MWSGTDRQSPIYSLVSVRFGPNSTKEKFDSTLGGVMSYYPGLVRREKKKFFSNKDTSSLCRKLVFVETYELKKRGISQCRWDKFPNTSLVKPLIFLFYVGRSFSYYFLLEQPVFMQYFSQECGTNIHSNQTFSNKNLFLNLFTLLLIM